MAPRRDEAVTERMTDDAIVTAVRAARLDGPRGGERPAPAPRRPAPRRMTRGGDLVTAGLSAWLVLGIFLDGWAHNTRPTLETFFTPWHAAFYTGFLALAGWIVRAAWRGRPAAAWSLAGPPAGYGAACWGVLVFGLSGAGDMLWHLAFGIERDLGALLSPTHLGLFVGALLMVTAPVRSAWADPFEPGLGWRALLPAGLSLALAGCLTGFILQPFHPLAYNFVSRRLAAMLLERFSSSTFVVNRNVETGLAGFMLATVFLFGPVLVLLYRWRPPVGMITAMVTLQCLLVQGMRGFREPSLALFGGLGALAVEALAWGLRPGGDRLGRLRVFCGVAPPSFWAIYLAGIALRDQGLGWSPELWGGALVWTGLTLVGPTIVMAPRAVASPGPPAALPADDRDPGTAPA